MSDNHPNPPAAGCRFTVDNGETGGTGETGGGGMRLGQFLARRLSLSLSQTNRLLDRGLVQVDHWIARRKHKGYKLSANQVVQVAAFVAPGHEQVIPNPQLVVPVLAADADRGWVIVNKPAGLPVHPLEPGERDTVLNALIAAHPQMQGVGEGSLRSGIVHRLDVDTSGTLLLATRQDTWQRLRTAFTEHRTLKRYRAIVLGQLQGEGTEKMLLNIARHKPATVRVVDDEAPSSQWPPGTRWCDLQWRTIETFAEATLIEIDLGTGFLHQIRAMFSHLGHPVAGDAHYARAEVDDPTGAPRPMLHACQLQVEEAEAQCDPPTDFEEVIQRLRQQPRG